MTRSIVDTLRHMNGGVFLDDASDALAEVVRPDRVFKTAVSSEIEKIEAATQLLVLFGKP